MMASKAIAHLAFMLIAVVLARSLNRAEFGTFNQVWLVNKSLLYLFELGLPVSVYYFLPRLAGDRQKGFILQTLLSLTLFAIPFSLVMYLLADPLALHFHNPQLAHYLRLFALYPLVTLPAIATEPILLSLERTGKAALFESATKMAMIAAVAAAAILGRGLDGVFQALIAYGIAQSLLGIWLVWQPVRRLKLKFSLADWRTQLTYAAPYGFSTLAGALNYQIDKVLVSLFNPPAVFAVYAAGAFEIPLGGVTSLPVVSVMMGELTQKFADGDIQGFLQLWHQSMRKLALLVFAVTGFLMVFAEPVVTGLFSAKYADSVWPFRTYLLFSPLRITVLDYVLAALGKTRSVFQAQLVAAIANAAFGYLLIQRIGWLGAAFCAVASGYLFSSLLIWQIQQRLQVSLGQIVPWADLAKVAWVAIAAGIGSFPVLFLPLGTVGKLGIGFLLYGTIYWLGNLKTQAMAAGEVKTLVSWALSKTQARINKRQ
jgi:O-antigen/teichoic acid export membrane protein